MAVDGAPFVAPWYVRAVGPWLKKRMISRPMKPGFRLPKNASKLLPQPIEAADGVARLEKAIRRLQSTTERKPSPVFGPMSSDEWDQLMFRHCELHLSFIVPE